MGSMYQANANSVKARHYFAASLDRHSHKRVIHKSRNVKNDENKGEGEWCDRNSRSNEFIFLISHLRY